jgi:anthranilate phosphoribosyltransferase
MEMYLRQLLSGEDLSGTEISHIINQIMHRQVGDVWIAGLLSLWAAKGETPDEIAELVKSIRKYLPKLSLPDTVSDTAVVDLVGTGGDGQNTLNISTASAVVTAACGVRVAKHGNHSSSSQCGSADILDAWKIRYRGEPTLATTCLEKCGICFCYARQCNPVMNKLAPIRKKLGIRTCFNILGPLLNPFPVQTILVGVYSIEWLQPMAEILKSVGVTRGMVVHSQGMDEATTLGETLYYEIHPDYPEPIKGKLEPSELGFSQGSLSGLRGSNPEYNANCLTNVLRDRLTTDHNRTIRETLALNAGIAVYLAGKAETIQAGCVMAWGVIQSGHAYQKLQEWKTVSEEIYT